MKRFTTLCLAAVMAISMAACGNSSGSTSDGETNAQSSAGETAAPASVSGDGTEAAVQDTQTVQDSQSAQSGAADSTDTGSADVTDIGYDKLIIASGAVPVVPDMPGKNLPGVFCMRTPDDAISLLDYVKANGCRNAAVVGAGFIGLEAAENLKSQGLAVTVVDAASQIMPGAFDPEMADYAKRRLKDAGIRVITGSKIVSVKGDTRAEGIVTDNGELSADVVVLAIGVRPATGFLKDTGIEMFKGTVLVDSQLRTNIPDIYAAGDCAMVHNRQTGKPQWSAMGSTANIAARVMAKAISGKDDSYKGCFGTGVVKLLPELNAGRTGLTEAQALSEGYDPATVVCVTDDKAHYYP